MKSQRPALLTLALAALLATPGCALFGRKTKPQPPPAPAPQVVAPPTEQPKPVVVVEQPPPAEPPKPVQSPAETPVEQPHKQPRPRVRPPKPPRTVTPPAPTPTPAPAPPAFGEILTPERQAQALQTYEQSSRAAQRVLSQLSGRTLNQDQAATANRVRSFLKQAAETRASDPSTAARLAQRAETLVNNLLNSLQ